MLTAIQGDAKYARRLMTSVIQGKRHQSMTFSSADVPAGRSAKGSVAKPLTKPQDPDWLPAILHPFWPFNITHYQLATGLIAMIAIPITAALLVYCWALIHTLRACRCQPRPGSWSNERANRSWTKFNSLNPRRSSLNRARMDFFSD